MLQDKLVYRCRSCLDFFDRTAYDSHCEFHKPPLTPSTKKTANHFCRRMASFHKIWTNTHSLERADLLEQRRLLFVYVFHLKNFGDLLSIDFGSHRIWPFVLKEKRRALSESKSTWTKNLSFRKNIASRPVRLLWQIIRFTAIFSSYWVRRSKKSTGTKTYCRWGLWSSIVCSSAVWKRKMVKFRFPTSLRKAFLTWWGMCPATTNYQDKA